MVLRTGRAPWRRCPLLCAARCGSPARRLLPPLPPLLPRPRRPAAAAPAAAAAGRGPAAAVADQSADQSAAATAPPTDPLPPLPRLHARRWTPGALPARGRTALRPAASPAAAAARRTWACVQELKGVRRSSRVDLRHCRRMLCRQIAEAVPDTRSKVMFAKSRSSCSIARSAGV